MTFERLQPKSASEIPLLQDVLTSLVRNDPLLQRQFGQGVIQISWPGHYFGLIEPSELDELRDALQFELMCWGASERRLYL